MSKGNKTSDNPQNGNDFIADVRRSVTITMPLDIAETLHALIDGSIGTSDDDEFNRQMMSVRDKLERRINKHYA